MCCLTASCSVYDADLMTVEPGQPLAADPPMSMANGQDAGANPVSPNEAGPAESMDAQPAESTDAQPAGSTDAQRLPPVQLDSTRCGDGQVTGEEKCDVGIAPGMPGACPTTCPELAPCSQRALNNSGCQAECVLLQLLCKNDDACCPGNCTDENDNDCSSNCGDGVVEADAGETCDPESSTPCKTNDAQCDDMDMCTVDELIGAAKNCTALCTNIRITAPKDGDSCCPAGANANNDNDCKPVCGNAVREQSEDCDGSEGCDAQCHLPMLQTDQIRCLEKFAAAGDECARCSCMNCTSGYLLCRDSPDVRLNMLCDDVLACAQATNCYGTACYCGDAFFCTPPNGLCRTQIEAASESTDPNLVNARSGDTNYAVGRAYATEMCRMQQCRQQCRM